METHVLMGAENVQRAASVMREAAQTFAHAVSQLEAEHRRHEEALRQLLYEDRLDRQGGNA